METDQLIKALARAVESAKPAQEYCFFWIDWWATCMTKAEWSGWMQAIGAVLAIGFSGAVAAMQIRAARIEAENDRFEARRLAANMRQLDDLKRSEMLMAMLAVTLKACTKAKENFDNGKFHKTPASLLAHLAECADQILSLPMFDIPGRDVGIGIAVLPRQLRTTFEFGTQLKANLLGGVVQEGLDSAFSVSLVTLVEELDSVLTLLGAQVRNLRKLTGVAD